MRSVFRVGAAICALMVASAAWAGPPYETDDPEPTELGRWEVYAFASADGRHDEIEGESGFDLNYGASEGLQLTATVPVNFAHSRGDGWRAASGDLELAAKYRFVNDQQSAVQAAVFPRMILPTSGKGLGGGRLRLLLPLWVQKDFGATSVFGGGGYEINPGRDDRNFWQTGIAVTHALDDKLSLGTEVRYQGADTKAGSANTGVNLALIRKLGGPYALLVAAGPKRSGGKTSYHSYVALAMNF